MTGKLWVALLAAVVVAWVVRALSAGRRASRQRGGHRLAEYGALYFVTLGLGGSFFGALAGLAWRFPGKTDPAVVPGVIGLFLGLAGFSLLGLMLASRSAVRWNATELEGADLLGRRHRWAWSELARVEFVEWAGMLRLVSQDGRRICLSPMMRGFGDFHAELTRQAEMTGLPLPEIRPEVNPADDPR